MKKRIRAVAIIIRNDEVLLMQRKSKGKAYYVFPGGGVEDNETIAEAVLREVGEETSLEVAIKKLLYHHHYVNDSDQYFYLCSYLSGEPALGDANEKEEMINDADSFYNPTWMKIDNLRDTLLYPLEIRDWLLEDISNNFQNTPRKESLQTNKHRQSL